MRKCGRIVVNYHRRHDTRQQLGISAGEADELQKRYEKEALDRKGEGGKKAGRGRPQKDVATSPHPIVGRKSRDDLGKAFGVSGRTADTTTFRIQFPSTQGKM